MKQIIKFIRLNRNFIILGILLTGLPVLLILSQTTQVFSPRADVSDPAVTGVGAFNSSTTPYPPGSLVTTTVSLNSYAQHFDAYYIDANAHPSPNMNDAFTPINELVGRPTGSYPWVVPTTPGHYYFVVNAHSRPDHSADDWNQGATTLIDIGCAWDGKIYLGPPPLNTNNLPCTNVGLKEFWVGTTSTVSPSPSPSSATTAQPPIPSRNPRSSPSPPTYLFGDCINTDFDCLSKDPIELTGSLYTIGLGLVGGVGILFMIIGAYIILSSQGDPSKVAKGKEYITYSIIGILLALFGYAFYQIIAVDILNLPGFSR